MSTPNPAAAAVPLVATFDGFSAGTVPTPDGDRVMLQLDQRAGVVRGVLVVKPADALEIADALYRAGGQAPPPRGLEVARHVPHGVNGHGHR